MFTDAKSQSLIRSHRAIAVLLCALLAVTSFWSNTSPASAQSRDELTATQASPTSPINGSEVPDEQNGGEDTQRVFAAGPPPWSYSGEVMMENPISRCAAWKTPNGGQYKSSVLRRGYYFDDGSGTPFGYDKARGKHNIWNRNVWAAVVGFSGGCTESQSNSTAGVFRNWFDHVSCRSIGGVVQFDCKVLESQWVRSIEVQSAKNNVPPNNQMLGNLSIYCEISSAEPRCPTWVGLAVPPNAGDSFPRTN